MPSRSQFFRTWNVHFCIAYSCRYWKLQGAQRVIALVNSFDFLLFLILYISALGRLLRFYLMPSDSDIRICSIAFYRKIRYRQFTKWFETLKINFSNRSSQLIENHSRIHFAFKFSGTLYGFLDIAPNALLKSSRSALFFHFLWKFLTENKNVFLYYSALWIIHFYMIFIPFIVCFHTACSKKFSYSCTDKYMSIYLNVVLTIHSDKYRNFCQHCVP